MPAWFEVRPQDKQEREDRPTLNQTRQIVSDLIDAEIVAGTPSEKIVLGGFSQGGAASIWSGFAESRKLGGILVLSSFAPAQTTFPSISQEANKNTPFLMLHGDKDRIIGLEWAQQSFAFLKEQGFTNGTFKIYEGMAHSTVREELVDVTEFLKTHIGSK
jgi:predicted esterase